MEAIRILIVENNEEFRNTLERILSGLGHAVAAVGSLEQALGLVAARTYHLALVDLSLSELASAQAEEDFKNQDGLKLVRQILGSGEGTQVIVLSGQPDPQVVADSLQEYGAHSFLAKKVFRNPEPGFGVEKFLALVQKHLGKVHLEIQDGHDNALRCLTMGKDSDIWIDQALRAFNPTYGQDGLRRYFTDFLNRLGPVRQLCGNPWAITPDMRRNRALGRFWSKAHGTACLAVFGASRALLEEEIAERVPQPLTPLLPDCVEFNIHGRVYALPEEPRHLFREP